MDAEVGIIGVGTMGAMAAWRLARRGVSVLGFEQYAPGHDQAAAGGESRIFRTAYREGVQYVPFLQSAQVLWRELEAESGRSLLNLTGGLMIGEEQTPEMQNVIASARRFDLAHEVLDREAMSRRYPQHVMRDGEIAVLDQAAGLLRPEFAVLAAAECARSRGATILPSRRVVSVEPSTDGVRIHTGSGSYLVGRAIVACGSWSAKLLPGLADFLEPRRIFLTWFPAKDPAAFLPDRFPVFIRDSGVHLYGVPTLDGGSVKVSGAEGNRNVTDPDALQRTVAQDELVAVRQAVERFLPGLTPTPVRVSVYTDAYTTDHHALVGRSPQHDKVWLMTGFSGHGFKMAPAIGETMAQLVSGEECTYPAEHLSPARITGGTMPH